MNLIILFAILAMGSCEEFVTCYTCVYVEKTGYRVSHFLNLEAPFSNNIVINKLGVLRSKHLLFFSFESEISNKEYYKVGYVNLDNTNESGILSGGENSILNFGTFDIDQDNGLIYLGGSDGIYVLDSNSNKLTPYSNKGETITDIFYKAFVYFVKYDDNGIIVKQGDHFKTYLEHMTIKNFVVNKYDIFVVLTKYGLFVTKGDVTKQVSENAFFRGLAVDFKGDVYTWWIDGIYMVIVELNIVNSKLVKIADMSTIGALTFDNLNNMIFTSGKTLYTMRPSSHCV